MPSCQLESSALPAKVDCPSTWAGSELTHKHDLWIWELTDEEIKELTSAARQVLENSSSLQLPVMANSLEGLRESLTNGLGFALIRGLPVQQMSAKEIEIVFRGFGSYVGKEVPQNANGDLLGHVRDFGLDSTDPNTRIYQTNERQTFHTDSCDVVGLLCLQEARSGGESLVVSAATIYNEFGLRRPDLIPYLFDRVATDRRGEVPPGGKPFFRIPVLSWHMGFLTVMYQRQYIESAQRFDDAPRLTKEHLEAFDLFDEIANDPEIHLRMRLRAGDMQFVHNHSLLHDRTSFEDWPEPERKRHLLRLWLTVDGDRPLPSYFAERFGNVEIGNRGGVTV